jgi:TetR/AcrR family transcriptional regulator
MKLGLTSTTLRDPSATLLEGPPQSAVRRKGARVPSELAAMLERDRDPPVKRERNALETKRRILEAATAEFAAKGFDGARLGSIARAAYVQQALIHHYFADKEGLHREVVRSGLAAMTEGAWELLKRMDAPRPKAKTKKGKAAHDPRELEILAEAFVDLLLRFFATNRSFLQILRHEARSTNDSSRRGEDATKIVADTVAPVFDGIVARLDAMRARGEVRKDVDAKHLVLSCVAMVAFPFQEEPFVAAIWPADWHDGAFLAERKKHVVDMILARVLP